MRLMNSLGRVLAEFKGRTVAFRRLLAGALVVASGCTLLVADPLRAQPPREEFKNLKVLPKDLAPADLRRTMAGFTRALGVRCIYCHVGEEGKPFRHEDFPLDDKPTKLKAREMLRMVKDINDTYLAKLDHRAEPPIRVQCATCHHGATQPRMLQDVLRASYDNGGLDSTRARYQALRDRYYGGFTYDFGEVPLADVASGLLEAGHGADAESLFTMNIAMNPSSNFARRQYAQASIFNAFLSDPAAGVTRAHERRDQFGPTMISEGFINDIAYGLLRASHLEAAVAAFRLNVADYPASANAYDSMGEGLLQQGDWKAARDAYAKSLELDPKNDNAREQLDTIKKTPKSKFKRSS